MLLLSTVGIRNNKLFYVDKTKTLKISIFPPLLLYAINPTNGTRGHFVLSPVSLASRDEDGGTVNSCTTSNITGGPSAR